MNTEIGTAPANLLDALAARVRYTSGTLVPGPTADLCPADHVVDYVLCRDRRSKEALIPLRTVSYEVLRASLITADGRQLLDEIREARLAGDDEALLRLLSLHGNRYHCDLAAGRSRLLLCGVSRVGETDIHLTSTGECSFDLVVIPNLQIWAPLTDHAERRREEQPDFIPLLPAPDIRRVFAVPPDLDDTADIYMGPHGTFMVLPKGTDPGWRVDATPWPTVPASTLVWAARYQVGLVYVYGERMIDKVGWLPVSMLAL